MHCAPSSTTASLPPRFAKPPRHRSPNCKRPWCLIEKGKRSQPPSSQSSRRTRRSRRHDAWPPFAKLYSSLKKTKCLRETHIRPISHICNIIFTIIFMRNLKDTIPLILSALYGNMHAFSHHVISYRNSYDYCFRSLSGCITKRTPKQT